MFCLPLAFRLTHSVATPYPSYISLSDSAPSTPVVPSDNHVLPLFNPYDRLAIWWFNFNLAHPNSSEDLKKRVTGMACFSLFFIFLSLTHFVVMPQSNLN